MLFLTGDIDTAIITVIFLFLIIFELYIYKKMEKGLGTTILLFCLIFSLYFVWNSYNISFPFSPYFQLLLLLLNIILLIAKVRK